MPSTKQRSKRRDAKHREIDRTGLPVEHQRLRHLLFRGKTAAWAAKATGCTQALAQKVQRELIDAGCGPKDAGPFTVAQAAVVLGIKVRRTRYLCLHGRIGTPYGNSEAKRNYVISREDLESFGARQRLSGHPGQVARQEERQHQNGADE